MLARNVMQEINQDSEMDQEPGREQENEWFENFGLTRHPLKSLEKGVSKAAGVGASIMGAPTDLGISAANAAMGVGEFLGLKNVPYIDPSKYGSSLIRDKANEAYESIGGDIISDEDLSSTERVGLSAAEFALEGLLGGASLARGAAAGVGQGSKFLGSLTEPYAKNAARTIAGDVSAGAGSGTGLGLYNELVPEEYQGRLGALVASISGGGVGAITPSPARALARRSQGSRTATPFEPDPATGDTPNNRTADKAARFLQDNTSNVSNVSSNLRDAVSEFGDTGIPTLARIADDPGLSILESQRRNSNPKPFEEADRAARVKATDEINSLTPKDADPTALNRIAQDQSTQITNRGNLVTDEATKRLETANQFENEIGGHYESFADQARPAGEDLDRAIVDETYIPRRTQKNDNYKNADPNGDVFVQTQSTREAAKGLSNELEDLPPSFRAMSTEKGVLDDLSNLPEQEKLSTVLSMKQRLSASGQEAQRAGRFAESDAYGKIRKGMGVDISETAKTGAPGTERLAEAERYFKDDFAPYFRNTFGSKEFFKSIDRDPLRSATPPSNTANLFLRTGAGGKEASASLRKIIEISPNPAEGEKAVRRYVLADMAKVIGADGKIHPNRLRRWVRNRKAVIDEHPQLSAEILKLSILVGKASNKSTRLADELKEVVANAELSKQDFDKSALAVFIDADPEKAVAKIFRANDPSILIGQLRQQFKGHAPAEQGLRATVTDYLVSKATGIQRSAREGAEGTLDASKALSFFKANEKALHTIYGNDIAVLRRAFNRIEKAGRETVGSAGGDGQIMDTGILAKALKPVEFAVRMIYGALEGGSKVKKYKLVAASLPGGTSAANELISRAMFDPKVARHLLDRPLPEIGTPRWNGKLNRLLGYAHAVGEGEE